MTSSPVATYAEQPLCHLTPAVQRAASQWLAKMNFDDVAEYAAAVVARLGDPEPPGGGGGGKSSKGGSSSSSSSSAPPARPGAGVLVTVALILRAVPMALSPSARSRLMAPKQSKLSQPQCAPTLSWVVAQSCAGNAAAGLGLWSRTMLPAALDAAGKRGHYGGKSSAAERDETTRLATALAEHLTATAAARRRLSGTASAMSVDTGVDPAAVDALLRAGPAASPGVAAMLPFLVETCRAPNGAQRAAGVAVKMWPLAVGQAGFTSGASNAADQARDEVIRALGMDNLAWCVGAGTAAAARSDLPELCEAAPEIARDIMRRVADALEGTRSPGAATVAGGKSALLRKKTALSEAAAEIRSAAARAARGESGAKKSAAKAWRELDALAKRVQKVVGVGGAGGASSSFSDVVTTGVVTLGYLAVAAIAAAAPAAYMTTAEGGWMLASLLSAVPGDRVGIVNATVFAVANEVEAVRTAVSGVIVGVAGTGRGYTL